MSYDEEVDQILATANQQLDRIVPDMLEARRPAYNPLQNCDPGIFGGIFGGFGMVKRVSIFGDLFSF
jgi:hypothetical protein